MEELTYKRINETTVEINGDKYEKQHQDNSYKAFCECKLAVHCPTEHEAELLLAYLTGCGVEWSFSKYPILRAHYETYGENTCYTNNGIPATSLEYEEKSFYESKGFPVIPFSKELLAQWQSEREE